MEFEVTLSSAFLKKFHLRRLSKGWWGFAIAFSLILVDVFTDNTEDGLGTASIIGLSAIGVLLATYTAAWGQILRMINDWEQKQGNHPVTYRLSELDIEIESRISSTKLKWSAFKKLEIQNWILC